MIRTLLTVLVLNLLSTLVLGEWQEMGNNLVEIPSMWILIQSNNIKGMFFGGCCLIS